MSDLISRSEYKSKLVKALDVLNKEYREALLNEDNDLILSIQNQQSAYMIALRLLDNEPTAYDIGNVVSELEERTDFLKNCTKYGNKNERQQAESYSTMMMYEVADLVDNLIEIVKQGGVYDDVCEWEKGSSGYVGYPAYYSKCCATKSKGLEMQTHIIADWEYCPYCGKKIKVVEQMDEEEYCYCHIDDTDEHHDCLDYMECEECPYYYSDLDQESD